jgi:ketosteroid isomerase-like protein
VIEMPFAAPGAPRRIQGRDAWLAYARASEGVLPVRIDGHRQIALYEPADPDVVVVEYELTAAVTATGERMSADFIGVLRTRDARIMHWREYQNVLATAEAFGRSPDRLDGLGDEE